MKMLFILLAAAPLLSSAACNPDNDLEAGPSGNLKIFLNYEHDGMSGFGNSESSRPFPVPLPAEALSRDRMGELKGDSNTLTYFEPDGKAGWRPCRIETWWPLDMGEDNAFSKRYAQGDQFLTRLAKERRIAFADRYQYDAKGRIEKVETIRFNKSPLQFAPQSCNRYDEKDRLVLWVSSPIAKVCPKGEPSNDDEWRKFRYGIRNGVEQVTFQRWHFPRKSETWVENWGASRPDGVLYGFDGIAKAYGKYGVYRMAGQFIGKADDNKGNSALTRQGKRGLVEYIFTKPGTPLSVLENPEELYNYDRRRETRFDSVSVILEHFSAGSHVTRHRYFMLGPYAIRDEQYDEKGKLTRIITLFDDHPIGAWNEVKLPTSDKIPLGHKVFHRVYDFDAQGKPKLVAVSWNENFSLKSEIALPDAKLLFGAPNGKQQWKDIVEFERVFDTSENGRHVYKEPYNPAERESDE